MAAEHDETTGSAHSSHRTLARRECLSAAELRQRLDEEIARAERHATALSCLLVSIDHVERLAGLHGPQLPERAISYLGEALERQLRRFDRVGRLGQGELLVLLPGADEQRAELVARRSLGRLHAIKVELDGVRRPLHVSIGIAAWQAGWDVDELLSRVRLAARAGHADDPASGPDDPVSGPDDPASGPDDPATQPGEERAAGAPVQAPPPRRS